MKALEGKTILVTGGTGSFGKHFIKHLLTHSKVKKAIVFSRDELKQFEMAQELKNDERLRFFLGDVRDLPRLERAFQDVDVVVHAAALKQVPMLEYNPYEAVKTNILGSQNVIEASLNQGVGKVVLVSTDKAAMPVNLYGSTKLCAEKLFVAGNSYTGGKRKTRFSVVRYGNVVGSRGSIVEKLIRDKNAHTVHITDERMTRFWIDLEQAFDLVLFALAHMEGGETFIPKAPAMTLTDLFDLLMPNAKRKVIGIRPGEKIHEALLTKEEARHAVDFKGYFVVLPENINSANHEKALAKFKKQGKALPKDFHYSSDMADNRLSQQALLSIVGRMRERLGVE